MKAELLERAKAMIAEAVAQARTASIARLHLTFYPSAEASLETIRAAIDTARQGTPAERAELRITEAPTRYICWNCCGLRFEGHEGICPNCGSQALIVPDEIVFALTRVDTTDD